MAVKHFSEEDIQNYLDGNLSAAERANFQNHLVDCKLCHSKLDAYKQLYTRMSQEPDFQLSPRFPSLVMARIKAESGSFFSVPVQDILLSILGLIAGLGTTIYFVDISRFAAPFKKFFTGTEEMMVSSVRDSVHGISIDFQIILSVVAILAAIAVIDRFVARHKEKLAASLKMMPMSCFL